jgi:hypothetical protein
VQRIVKVLAVAVLVATVLVISSTMAFARPLRGGVPLQNEKVCDKMLAENHPRFEVRTTSEIGPCWHVSPGLGIASGDAEPPPR